MIYNTAVLYDATASAFRRSPAAARRFHDGRTRHYGFISSRHRSDSTMCAATAVAFTGMVSRHAQKHRRNISQRARFFACHRLISPRMG